MPILRSLLLAAVCLASLSAQQSTTVVTGTITTPIAQNPSGTCKFQDGVGFTSSGGYQVIGQPVSVTFNNGYLRVPLIPNTVPGGQCYVVSCRIPRQIVNGFPVGPENLPKQYWIVPPSATPLNITQVSVPYGTCQGGGVPTNAMTWPNSPPMTWNGVIMQWN